MNWCKGCSFLLLKPSKYSRKAK
ncbi:rCG55592 [Rattus norvegicus]|uniref:RCG55592 n=1 Tax=Rattus norvegicus TaxID=10116 RepID=A6JR59_RAT|nr:rCG55592 [Rattus norvegicus]